jgi:hypothetical protein
MARPSRIWIIVMIWSKTATWLSTRWSHRLRRESPERGGEGRSGPRRDRGDRPRREGGEQGGTSEFAAQAFLTGDRV